MILDGTLDTQTISRRFGRQIGQRHCYALDVFRVDRLPGESVEERLSSLLGAIVDLLCRPEHARLWSLSILLENGVFRWTPCDVSVLGIYFGGSDHLYRGSHEEQVREALRLHPAYVGSESGSPDERAILFGYFSPRGRTFYVAREVFPLIADQITWAVSPPCGTSAWWGA
ncbi:MAG: hypothetical protein ACYDA8_09050 [Deferrisomatales bacterium]